MKRKEKQLSGELPPPSAEELEKERKLQEAQLAMARERAHAHALKEYKDEYEREMEAKLSSRKRSSRAAAHGRACSNEEEIWPYRRCGRAHRGGPVAGHPLFRETRAQRRQGGRREGAQEEFHDPSASLSRTGTRIIPDRERSASRGKGWGTPQTKCRRWLQSLFFLPIEQAHKWLDRPHLRARAPFRPISRHASLAAYVPLFFQ